MSAPPVFKIEIDGVARPAADYVVPPKDHLRSAWRWPANGRIIEIDLPAGRELVRGFVRQKRAVEWPWVDAERLKADDAGDVHRKAALVAYAVTLRDATAHSSIDDAGDAAALRAITLASIAGARPGEG